jgi:outer membrane protein OmpA-like peptidoglycan-associated protein
VDFNFPEEITMRKKIMLIGIAVSLIAGPAMAEQGLPSKEEKIGLGAGATIGAIAGGPVGFIIGAAIGAKIGDEFYERNDNVDTLNSFLTSSQQKITDLEQSIDALNIDIDDMGTEMQRLQVLARPELLDLMQVGIEMDLLFRTDEHVLVETTGTRLQNLAASLASMPEIQVRLDGFADERGDEEYNRELSARRVDHVREFLLNNGISASRIKTTAHGESPAADTNIDSYALERRVSLTLYVEEAPSFASNPGQ